MRESGALEKVGRGGKDDESHGETDAVDEETAEPLFEIVALGAKDKVLIEQKGDGDADGDGDREGNVCNKRLAEAGKEMAEELDAAGVEDEREYRIEAAHQEEAGHLAGRERAAHGGERAMGLRVRWSAIGREDGALERSHSPYSSRKTRMAAPPETARVYRRQPNSCKTALQETIRSKLPQR